MSEPEQEIPRSEESAPTQLGQGKPFAELIARIGLTQADLDAAAAEPVEGEPFEKHRDFERQTDRDGRERYQDPTDCGGTLLIVERDGPRWELRCDVCGFEVHVGMHKFDPHLLLEHRLKHAGLPEQFVGKDWEDDERQEPTLRACRTWLRTFSASQLADAIPAIALFGKAGRGKSHLLSLMVQTLIKANEVDAAYWSAAELFDQLRAGMDTGSYEIRWQRVLRIPVLAIDDVGAGRWTEWTQDRFSTLVDHRYSKGLPLLIATNIPPAGWDAKFGERTSSRLKGMCLRFELEGVDRRVSAQTSLLAGAPA